MIKIAIVSIAESLQNRQDSQLGHISSF